MSTKIKKVKQPVAVKLPTTAIIKAGDYLHFENPIDWIRKPLEGDQYKHIVEVNSGFSACGKTVEQATRLYTASATGKLLKVTRRVHVEMDEEVRVEEPIEVELGKVTRHMGSGSATITFVGNRPGAPNKYLRIVDDEYPNEVFITIDADQIGNLSRMLYKAKKLRDRK